MVLKEVFIAANDPSHGVGTDFGGYEEGAIIVGTSAGIIAKFSNEGGFCEDEVSVSWANLLKHVPPKSFEKERERRG